MEVGKDLEANENKIIMNGNGGYVSTYGKEVIRMIAKKITSLEVILELQKTEDTQHIKNTKDVLK